jgi:hypothetical protein
VNNCFSCQALVDFIFNNVLTDSSNGDAIAKYMYLMAKNPNVGGQFTKKYYSKLEKMYAGGFSMTKFSL